MVVTKIFYVDRHKDIDIEAKRWRIVFKIVLDQLLKAVESKAAACQKVKYDEVVKGLPLAAQEHNSRAADSLADWLVEDARRRDAQTAFLYNRSMSRRTRRMDHKRKRRAPFHPSTASTRVVVQEAALGTSHKCNSDASKNFPSTVLLPCNRPPRRCNEIHRMRPHLYKLQQPRAVY
eukprot:TRINITY_DN356_c0_g1_i4.p2 TRINITY_DN356_c0_g1~~TRINITY_DN356_c0_g1_i4.p2  ORF type:complete len:177 (+),score=16.98 TRINITY_DN356_c0_g1_i4:175-705(+)